MRMMRLKKILPTVFLMSPPPVCHKNEVVYGESISLESYVPTKYEYTFKGWFTDPRTKQNQVTTFKFAKPDILYAKWDLEYNIKLRFYLFASENLCSIAAVSALVALSCGLRVLSVLPLISPIPTAY